MVSGSNFFARESTQINARRDRAARERGESVTSSAPVYPKECLRDHIVERC